MKTACSRIVWTVGLLGVSAAALAGEPPAAKPQEPVGFITGGVIGGFAAGPVGAVIGAGLGTWLGNRVHRAGDATRAEARLGALQSEATRLRAEIAAQTASVEEAAGKELNGLQGDVLFRTGSAEIDPETVQGLKVLAETVAKSPTLKVRVDGYADGRGPVDANLELSEARADAVRDVFRAAGVADEALEINAFGKSRSVAVDPDGLALERRVRLTLQADGAPAVAAAGQPPTGTE